MKIREIIASALGSKRVELVLDDCPLYDYSQAGRIPLDEMEASKRIMKKMNNIPDGN
jgi:hypothetical protein